MVYSKKKGANVTRNVQGNQGKALALAVEENDSMDDSEEETMIQRTPKGRQSLGEKKVSFQIQGKNTPTGKVGKNTPLGKVGKNTPLGKATPMSAGKGKMGIQEFKGMMGKPNKQKGQEEDDEDDEDDDDDLDLDDLEDDDEDDEGKEGEGEDEDDDDDEDDDEDDDDEEEEIDNKDKIQTLISLKQNNGEQKSKVAKSNEVKIQVKKEKSPKRVEQENSELERRRQRDSTMLYVGKLPKNTTPQEVKNLSSDAVDCIMPSLNRQNQNSVTYAFLVFASEEKAEENYKRLQGKQIGSQLLVIDLVGEKSKNKPAKREDGKQYETKKLHIGGVPFTATISQVAEFFPKASQVSLTGSPSFRSAGVSFLTDEDASEAYEANKTVTVAGVKLAVLHALSSSSKAKRGKRKRGGAAHRGGMRGGQMHRPGGRPQKKMKFKDESDDDE